ncbi:MAG: plasma-membrane proton-efflux P-type ATPase [Candidatus Heimdallarchaeota archaeon]
MPDRDHKILLDSSWVESSAIDEVLEQLETSNTGLSTEVAQSRLEKWGPNVLAESHVHPILKFLSYFWGPIPWMIEAAAFLSLLVQDWVDFTIICVMLIANATIGFWQEFKADNAIALLKKNLALQARVKRNGSWSTIPARELVLGDIVHIRLGGIIPADLKLLTAADVELDQSALTGESLPVQKHRGEVIYSGSSVQRGDAEGVVIATGMDTRFGKTARLVQETKPTSHYQETILQIGRFLIILTLGLVSLILLVSTFRNTSFVETLKFSLILTVAAIPVALPAVLSVTLAVGAERLARRQAIVSRLVSIEEMAGMDILCSDKTGTLTQNRMVLGESALFADITEAELIRYAALASRIEDQDPIELAIFEKLDQVEEMLGEWKIQSFMPFNPVIKRTEAEISHRTDHFKVSKGAVQAILNLCADAESLSENVTNEVNRLASRGYRTLGVARTDESNHWTFLGLLSLYDPPREDSTTTIAAMHQIGIEVKMLTGDHQAIAQEVATQLHMGANIVTAREFFTKEKPVDLSAIYEIDGFAQVYPEHKYRIVEVLQKDGHYVGMTGDGVNDAPALKKADVGIAVTGATDVARSAADIVLTAPGLSVITDATEESRRIFRRMNSYALYRIAETIRILFFMTLAILIFDFYPVTAIMIIILAILNDGPIMMIAYDNTDLPARPIHWEMEIILTVASLLGTLGLISSFLLFWITVQVLELSRPVIQTLIFLKLTVAGHMTIYLTRTAEKHFWERPLPSPALFMTSEATQIVATLFTIFGLLMTPIGWELALLVWLYAVGWFILNDFLKVQGYRLLMRFTRKLHLIDKNTTSKKE